MQTRLTAQSLVYNWENNKSEHFILLIQACLFYLVAFFYSLLHVLKYLLIWSIVMRADNKTIVKYSKGNAIQQAK